MLISKIYKPKPNVNTTLNKLPTAISFFRKLLPAVLKKFKTIFYRF